MRAHRAWILLVAGSAAGMVGCDKVSFPSVAPEARFQASLLGGNETPTPVTTPGTGTAMFAVTLDTFLSFRIDVATLDSATAAHIHEGAAGVPGSIIVTLYGGASACRNTAGEPINGTSPRCKAAYSGGLSQGQFAPSQLTQLPATYGTTPRARFDSLLALMRSGNVYVNVHTIANPGGHIRGQVQPQ